MNEDIVQVEEPEHDEPIIQTEEPPSDGPIDIHRAEDEGNSDER